MEAVRAYSELLDHLEARDDSNDFDGLQQLFEVICEKYQVRGFDRGTIITSNVDVNTRKKRDDSETFLTKGFLAVPGKLSDSSYDFTRYTQDPELLEAIRLIREEFLADGEPYAKSGRAMRGDDKNWIKAQWVNGATYNDFSQSCAKSRALDFTARLAQGEEVEFNAIVNPGGGEITADKRVMASVFSIYNLSKQMDAYKRAMDLEDMQEICEALDCEPDNTLILLYQRGNCASDITTQKQTEITHLSRIRHNSIFK